MATVLVTGATGTLGRRVTQRLAQRAHAVRALLRDPSASLPDEVAASPGDLITGLGLPDAVDGADVIVHCATDPRRHGLVDREGTERLLELAGRGGVAHVVYPSIVGCDVVPLRYYQSKRFVEEAIEASGMGYSIVRATQFPHLIWWFCSTLARVPLMLVPADTRAQVLDPDVLALRVADVVDSGPVGRMPDLGGPQVHTLEAYARSWRAATRRKRGIVTVNYPGIVGAAFRAGANLTPNRAEGTPGWNDFVARVLERTAQD